MNDVLGYLDLAMLYASTRYHLQKDSDPILDQIRRVMVSLCGEDDTQRFIDNAERHYETILTLVTSP